MIHIHRAGLVVALQARERLQAREMLLTLQARESLLFFHRLKASVIVFNLGETTSGTRDVANSPVRPVYWYKSTNTDAETATCRAVGAESLQAMI